LKRGIERIGIFALTIGCNGCSSTTGFSSLPPQATKMKLKLQL
jgi:hypothetical protein